MSARYVERCPIHEPVLATPVKDETTAKRRGAKSSKVIVDSCQVYMLMIVCCIELGMTVDYFCVCIHIQSVDCACDCSLTKITNLYFKVQLSQ